MEHFLIQKPSTFKELVRAGATSPVAI